MKKYLFVDFIRFWGMLSIVYVHSIQACDAAFHMRTNLMGHGYLYDCLQLPLKFGSICFYIISGFLLGDKLLTTSPASFLKKRLNNTSKPYFIALTLFVIWDSLGFFAEAREFFSLSLYGASLLARFKHTLLYSSYWFIWNFFIALSVIVACRKYLFTTIFPVLLMSITLVYSANVYFNWFPPEHTKAVFGFVFYLWAGVFIHKNQEVIQRLIEKIPLLIFLLVTLVFLCLGYYETIGLYARNAVDPHNTLKISTQMFSIAVFFMLMKVSHVGIPGFFNPRKETFGIYLYHLFFMVLFVRLVHFTSLNRFAEKQGVIAPIMLFFFYFACTYLSATLFVKAVNKTSLSWLVGNKNIHKPEKLAYELRPMPVEEED